LKNCSATWGCCSGRGDIADEAFLVMVLMRLSDILYAMVQ
jgi:hypothetical protein